jgi:choline dehydrogenase
MMYVRGAARDCDFDRWDEEVGRANQASWSAAAVMPIFKALEHADQQGAERGHEGPLYVRTVRHPHRLTRALVESAIAHGVPFNPDYNGESQEGVSYAQLSRKGGLRCSAADAFLKPLRAYSNVTAWTDALVKKIEIEGARAVGVTFLCESLTCTETADTIVLCVGANLQDHPLLRLTYRVNVERFNLSGGWPQKLGVASQFVLRREGPIANLFEGAAFLRTSPREPAPDIQLHFIPLGYTPTPDGGIGLAAIPSVSVLLNASYPKSRGRIRLPSANPDDVLLIEPRIFADGRDLETLVKGVAIVRAIMATQPVAGFVEEKIAPGASAQDGVALKDYIRAKTGIAFHPVGTCKMGLGPNAVVSPALNVHGFDNLYVGDASIMPSLISGNTNAVCMMIGKKAGQSLNALT